MFRNNEQARPLNSEICATRERVERAIRKAVEQMPRYYGTYIDPRDFVDDALLYALDDAVAEDAVLQAEDALLKELAAQREVVRRMQHASDNSVKGADGVPENPTDDHD